MNNLKNKKGITLVALVVAIIILIILAGISIRFIVGDNGIIKKARETRDDYIDTVEGVEKKLNDLRAEMKQKSEGKSTSTGLTVKKAYDDELIKIGDPFTYTGDTQTEWIVFGQEDDGDVLLTTAEPVADKRFSYFRDGEQWLNYETDLNAFCEKYGNTSKGIIGRSITVEDINRVTGYVEPEGTTIIFGTQYNTSGATTKYVNYYYPSEEAKDYITDISVNPKVYKWWKKASSESDIKIFTGMHPAYSYSSSSDLNNMEYVVGRPSTNAYGAISWTGSSVFNYVVASRSVFLGNYNYVYFSEGEVRSGEVRMNVAANQYSNADLRKEATSGMSWNSNIRPIAVLPGGIYVEEGTDGVYKLVE